MAQRTNDTPSILQNDNVAPLEFFIQLVSKFERDIQMLRQEIDNTEKHVNSLAYPSVLTPQGISYFLYVNTFDCRNLVRTWIKHLVANSFRVANK